jgi:hypothetical protein
MEDAFDQHAEGLLGDSAFNSMISTFKVAFSTPGFRAVWQVQRRAKTPPTLGASAV